MTGLKILDVGCGGGLLSEPLARLGAEVTALDAAEENINVAQAHADLDPEIRPRMTFQASTIEEFIKSNPEVKFDAVVASEVIEHVDNQAEFVKDCSKVLASGGSFFLTTLNRNKQSYMAGIVAAEYILGLLPQGTHDWNKFVTPEELQEMLKDAGCETRLVHGMFYWPGFNKWTWVEQTSVNYAIHAVKN